MEGFSPSHPLPRGLGFGGADVDSPPFVESATANARSDALPFHWLEISEILLEAASDDFAEPEQVRRLLRDLREIRLAKLRAGLEVLDAAGGVRLNGVGGMELAESRTFICGAIDELRYDCKIILSMTVSQD